MCKFDNTIGLEVISMVEMLSISDKKQNDIMEYMPSDGTISKLANFFSAFADPTRVKILTALCISNMCVGDISRVLKINQTTVSHQLKFLKQNGAVECFRRGKVIYYSISNANINNVMLGGVDCLLGA